MALHFSPLGPYDCRVCGLPCNDSDPWTMVGPGVQHCGCTDPDDDPDACAYCGASALDQHICPGYAADLAYEAERLRLVAAAAAQRLTLDLDPDVCGE